MTPAPLRVAVQEWLGAPALSYPDRPATVVHAFRAAVAAHPDRVAVVDATRAGEATGSGALTYAALAERVETAAASLRGHGLAPGDAVAVAAANSLDLLVTLLACARARVVMVGLNTRLAPAQWGYMTELMQARLFLAQQGFPLEGALPLDAVLRETGHPPLDPDDLPAEDDTLAVVFTSGTTGRPKASQVVHRCSVHSGMSYQQLLRLTPQDATAVLFPLYYISALHAHVLPAFLAGARCVLVDPTTPRDYLDTLAEHRVTWAYAVPSWWRLCLRAGGLERLTDLRVLAAGGAPFGTDLVAALRDALPQARLMDVYGLTETHSPACIATDEDLREAPGSVGRPLPCLEAEVRDEDGRVLPTGQAGRLWVRGSLVTTGYAHDPVATAAAIVDGWFDTGDVARLDDAGRVTVLDRAKDMINRGGSKVFSAEVEELLRRHPQVADAAVVGVPDDLAGESVVAYVVPHDPGDPPAAAAVRSHVRTGLGEHAVPKRVHLLDVLPRNAVGKTDKLALRARDGER